MRHGDRSEIQNAYDWLDSTFLVLLFLKHEPLTVRWGALPWSSPKKPPKMAENEHGIFGVRTQLV
jgi:hypothetical protein